MPDRAKDDRADRATHSPPNSLSLSFSTFCQPPLPPPPPPSLSSPPPPPPPPLSPLPPSPFPSPPPPPPSPFFPSSLSPSPPPPPPPSLPPLPPPSSALSSPTPFPPPSPPPPPPSPPSLPPPSSSTLPPPPPPSPPPSSFPPAPLSHRAARARRKARSAARFRGHGSARRNIRGRRQGRRDDPAPDADAVQPDGTYLPVLTCAQCGGRVFGNGSVLWAVDTQTRMPIAGPFLTHVHCYELFAQHFVALWPTVTLGSDSLSTFIAKLIAHSQLWLGA